MRLPDSRHPTYSRSRKSGIILFVAIIGAVAIIATVGYFVFSRNDGLIALPTAEEKESALQAWENSNYTKVLELTEKRLRDHPLDHEALVLHGFAKFYLSLEQVDLEERSDMLVSSIVSLRRALLTSSDRFLGPVHTVLGKAYFHRGQYFYDMTVVHLAKALSLGRSDSDVYEYLGVAHRDLGDIETGIEYFEQAIRMSPNAIYALAVAEMLEGQQKYAQAGQYIETAEGLPGADALADQIAIVKGRVAREAGDFEGALAVYDSILDRNPNSAAAHFGKGETYLAMGTTDRARYEWREALRLNPNHIESLQRLQEY